MADSTDRVSIELIDAGEHKDRVVMVLAKVKGLAMPAQQIVRSTPCTVATNVPRPIAEKLQEYLEKAGAMVMIEGGAKDLFATEEFSEPAAEEPPDQEPASALPEPELEPGDREVEEEETEVPPVSAPPPLPEPAKDSKSAEAASPGKLQQLLAKLPFWGRKKEPVASAPEHPDAEPAPPPKKFSWAGLAALLKRKAPNSQAASETTTTEPWWSKLRKPKAPQAQAEAEPGPIGSFLAKLRQPTKAAAAPMSRAEIPAEALAPTLEPGESAKKKMPDWIANPFAMIAMGFLLGAIVAGVWGRMAIHSLQNDYETKTGQQTALLQQISKETGELKQKNGNLEGQLATLIKQLGQGQQTPGAPAPGQQELVQALQKLLAVHAQSLAKGYDAQKQASCSQQFLLDGKSTYTYAQVVKKFDPASNKIDILKSNSLLTPYIAEFKIPFQQEIKTGNTEEACSAAALQPLPAPEHHEFGGYYGYWTIQYLYQEGKWVVNPTVIEKNRALYDSAFQKGSPDNAKFRIDTKIFPEFAAPPAQ